MNHIFGRAEPLNNNLCTDTASMKSRSLTRWGTRDEEPLVNGGVNRCGSLVLTPWDVELARVDAIR